MYYRVRRLTMSDWFNLVHGFDLIRYEYSFFFTLNISKTITVADVNNVKKATRLFFQNVILKSIKHFCSRSFFSLKYPVIFIVKFETDLLYKNVFKIRHDASYKNRVMVTGSVFAFSCLTAIWSPISGKLKRDIQISYMDRQSQMRIFLLFVRKYGCKKPLEQLSKNT